LTPTPLAGFYQDPIDEFSQGDIFDVSPNCWVDLPLRSVSQTDPPQIEEGIDLLKLAACTHLVNKNKTSRALIINHDCDIAKQTTSRWVVCPVVDLSDLPADDRGNAKKNRIAHLCFLPRHGAALPDSVAVLNRQTTITKELLCASTRIATLGAQGRLAFYAQFMRWLTRWEMRELQCPNCTTVFDASLALPVRNPQDP
jgi:hypothetical protein